MISLQCALAVFLDSAKNVILEPGSWSFPQISPKSATLHKNTIEIPRFLTFNTCPLYILSIFEPNKNWSNKRWFQLSSLKSPISVLHFLFIFVIFFPTYMIYSTFIYFKKQILPTRLSRAIFLYMSFNALIDRYMYFSSF